MRPSTSVTLLIALAAIVLVGALTVARRSERDIQQVQVVLASAPGLREGAMVTYRGIEVGQVREIALTDSGVLVMLGIARDEVPLRSADVVRVSTMGLFGDKVVEILPGSRSAPPLSSRGVLAARLDTTNAWDLTGMMARLAACTDSLRTTAADSPAVDRSTARP